MVTNSVAASWKDQNTVTLTTWAERDIHASFGNHKDRIRQKELTETEFVTFVKARKLYYFVYN